MSVPTAIFLKALIPVFVPFFVLLLSVVSVQNLLNLEQAEVKTRVADKALMSHTNVLSKLFNHCSVSLSVHSITKSSVYEYQFEQIAKAIPEELEKFKQLPVSSSHQRNLKDQVERSGEDGFKTIQSALSAIKDKNVADDVKQVRAKELYASITDHSQQLHETAQAIGKGVISEDREKGHSHRRIRYVGSILVAYLSAVIILFAFSKHMGRLIEQKKGVSITRKIFFQGVMPVFVPLLLLSSLVVVLTDQVHRAENEVRRLVRDIAIIEHANAVSDLVHEIGICSTGYNVTKNSHLSDRFDSSVAKIPQEISELQELFADQPDQLKLIAKIEQTVGKQIKQLTEERDLIRDNKKDLAPIQDNHKFGSTHYLADQTQDNLGVLSEAARKFEDESAGETASPTLIAGCLAIASAMLALLLCFLYAKTLSKYFTSDF